MSAKSNSRAQDRRVEPLDADTRASYVVSVSAGDLEALEERAAIMEYDGGLSRREAVCAAVANVRPPVVLTPSPRVGLSNCISQELLANPERIIADDPRLRPFINALAALLVQNLLKNPP